MSIIATVTICMMTFGPPNLDTRHFPVTNTTCNDQTFEIAPDKLAGLTPEDKLKSCEAVMNSDIDILNGRDRKAFFEAADKEYARMAARKNYKPKWPDNMYQGVLKGCSLGSDT